MMTNDLRTRWAAVVFCALVSTRCMAHAAPAPSPAAAPAPEAAGALVAMNQEARAVYGQAREEFLQATDPVLLVYSNDRLVLRHQGRSATFVYAPARPALLKAVAHAALATWTLLERGAHAPEAWRPRAEAFARKVEAAQQGLGSYGFAPAELARQQSLLTAVRDALQRIDGGPDAAGAFANRVSPWVAENTATAAQLLLDGLNARMYEVKKLLGPEKFAGLHVVVLSAHMARADEHAAQYFQRFFDGEPEGLRWVFAEGVRGDQGALDLLGIHLIDEQASTAFFHNPTRLHHDVMADAARAYLSTLTLPTR